MSGKVFICRDKNAGFPSFKLVNQLPSGRLYISSNFEENHLLRIFLKDAHGWDFINKKSIGFNNDYSENSIETFFRSIRDHGGGSKLITFHTAGSPKNDYQKILSQSLDYLTAISLENHLSNIFDYFDICCIWGLDNLPTIYFKNIETFDVLVNEIKMLVIDVSFVEENQMPVW